MIYNMRRRKKKPRQLTWQFYNNMSSYGESQKFSTNFESAGRAWTGIEVSATPKFGVTQMWYHTNNGNPYLSRVSVYTRTKGFENREHRTLIFDEEPTGELLAFLQANATPL